MSTPRFPGTGRNDPCTCGSGRKYKKCCGIAAAIVPIVAASTGASTVDALSARACGTCTACCEGWAAGVIRGHPMYPGQHCHFLSAGKCTIYDERPQSPCRNFVCGWLGQPESFPDEFRPDRIGVIVVRIRWRDAPAYILLSAGREPDEQLLVWMREFSLRTRRPFFYEHAGEKLGFGPPEFQQDMLHRLARGEPMW